MEDALNLENLDFIFAVNFRRYLFFKLFYKSNSFHQCCPTLPVGIAPSEENQRECAEHQLGHLHAHFRAIVVLCLPESCFGPLGSRICPNGSTRSARQHTEVRLFMIGAINTHTKSFFSPGPIETPIFERNHFPEENHELFEKATLLGRFGETAEMSTIIKFLCSDQEASYVTAANLVADGGMAVKH